MTNKTITYPIETARLYLRPYENDDLEDLHNFYSRPDVARYLYWEAKDLEGTRESLTLKKRNTKLAGANSALVLAAVLQETGVLIGEVMLFLRSVEHRQGEIGFVFNPDYHGRGYATEAAKVILRIGFENARLHRIYGRCDPRNNGSYRLMERLGMRKEAHFVHNEIFKGEWGDELYYAILENEWRAKYGGE
ncbi:MAG: GNAT family N-acetyltransferase [Candidatus Promineifilaceae bacterium]